MAVLIPINRGVDGPSYFDIQVTLDGTTYTLEFRWNARLEAWFMNVLDVEGVNAHSVGQRLVVDWPIPFAQVDRSPPGLFVALDTGATIGFGVDPGFDDLGARVQLIYVPIAELP